MLAKAARQTARVPLDKKTDRNRLESLERRKRSRGWSSQLICRHATVQKTAKRKRKTKGVWHLEEYFDGDVHGLR
jgi:hypothetical protein